ncbi:hypothetical protein RQP46_010432 [Phenoliferia psychrophenolica]
MLALLPAFLLATSAFARPPIAIAPRGGGLVGAFPSGAVPANVTSAGPGALATAQSGVVAAQAAPTAVIPAASTTLFGSNVIPGTIQITKQGDTTPYYLSFNQGFNNGLYTITTDRSSADNFTIPVNSCGSSATRFGVSSTVNPGNTPYLSPAAYAYYGQYYNQEQGQATRCSHTAPGAQAISSINGYVCESDIWNIDCKTNVLDALFTTGTYQLPIVFSTYTYQTYIQTFSAGLYQQIINQYNVSATFLPPTERLADECPRKYYYGGSAQYIQSLTLTFVADPSTDIVSRASGFVTSITAKPTRA